MFAGRNAIVTGGGSGMGEAIAKRLAAEGATVAVWDLNQMGAGATANSIVAAGGRAIAQQVDVVDSAAVDRAVAEIADVLGDVHILVNSAGVSAHRPILESGDDVFDLVVGVNLRGTFNCIRAALPGMRRAQWGRVVNIASLAGQAGVANLVVYSGAKAGVIGLTKAAAKELGGDGITCNCIAPGPIDTPMLRGSIAKGAFSETSSKGRTVAGRLGTVDEIAAAALYFIAETGAFVTGQTIGVNGGEYI